MHMHMSAGVYLHIIYIYTNNDNIYIYTYSFIEVRGPSWKACCFWAQRSSHARLKDLSKGIEDSQESVLDLEGCGFLLAYCEWLAPVLFGDVKGAHRKRAASPIRGSAVVGSFKYRPNIEGLL